MTSMQFFIFNRSKLALVLTPLALPFASNAIADEAPITLEAVTVTAQRRDENSQKVPISVNTLTAKSIENSGLTNFTDLQYLVPGLQYDPTQGSAFQIRGVGSTSFDFSNAKSVNVVVDDVVMDGQRINGLTGLYDLNQVDVLMGPQGTLFGKNSTSGVINVTTNKPVLNDKQFTLGAKYGERTDFVTNAIANIPMGESSAIRFSAFANGQDGYGRYTTLNQRLGTSIERGARIKFLTEPGKDLSILLSADYAYHWDTSIRTSVSGAPAIANAAQIALGVTPGPQNPDSADSSRGMIETKESGTSVKVNYKIGANTLTSITAVRTTNYNNDTPADLVPGNIYAYIPYNMGRLSTDKVSQEFRIASPTGQFAEYVGGLFYNRLSAQQTQVQWATLGAPTINADGSRATTFYALTGAIGAPGNTALFDAKDETSALFGQVKLNFSDAFSLNIGGRYTWDTNSQSLGYVNVDPLPITGVANPTFIATSAPPYYPYGQISSSKFTYRVAPQYQLSEEAMLYSSYTTGFKPSGIAFVGNKYDPYLEETVESFEIGIKSELFNRRLRLNADVYSQRFTNFQATVLTSIPGSAVLQSVIGNAGLLTSQGAELSATYLASKEWTVGGAITYTDAIFDNYVYNTTTNYSGTRLTNAPQWSASLYANYRAMIGGEKQLNASADYSYRSQYWTVVGQPSYSEVPAYGLLNAKVGVKELGNNLEYGVYARNLLNQYYSTGWQQYGALGLLHYTSQNAYRTLGIYATYNY